MPRFTLDARADCVNHRCACTISIVQGIICTYRHIPPNIIWYCEILMLPLNNESYWLFELHAAVCCIPFYHTTWATRILIYSAIGEITALAWCSIDTLSHFHILFEKSMFINIKVQAILSKIDLPSWIYHFSMDNFTQIKSKNGPEYFTVWYYPLKFILPHQTWENCFQCYSTLQSKTRKIFYKLIILFKWPDKSFFKQVTE